MIHIFFLHECFLCFVAYGDIKSGLKSEGFCLHILTNFCFVYKTRIGVMSCGTAGPLGSVPGMWNHLQGDQVN